MTILAILRLGIPKLLPWLRSTPGSARDCNTIAMLGDILRGEENAKNNDEKPIISDLGLVVKTYS